MKKKFLILLLCLFSLPIYTKALNVSKNWNNYTNVLPSGELGEKYEYKLVISENDLSENKDYPEDEDYGRDFYFTLINNTKLPEGLTLNTDGTITGTPTKAGKYTFTIMGKIYKYAEIHGGDVYRFYNHYNKIFTINVYENKLSTYDELTVNSGDNLGIYKNYNKKITNYGDLAIINNDYNVDIEGYIINNYSEAYISESNFYNSKNGSIYNEKKITLNNLSLNYNETDSHVIYNKGKMYINKLNLRQNTCTDYCIYNDGDIFLTGTLDTTILAGTNQNNDTIYLSSGSNFYLDLRNGQATISDYSKVQGYYNNGFRVIIDSELSEAKDYVLFENYSNVYYVNDVEDDDILSYFLKSKITRKTTSLEFYTMSEYGTKTTVVLGLREGGTFTYNDMFYQLVEENNKLILRATKVSNTTLPTEGTTVNELEPNIVTVETIERELNYKNIIILVVVIAIIIVLIIKNCTKKNNKNVNKEVKVTEKKVTKKNKIKKDEK